MSGGGGIANFMNSHRGPRRRYGRRPGYRRGRGRGRGIRDCPCAGNGGNGQSILKYKLNQILIVLIFALGVGADDYDYGGMQVSNYRLPNDYFVISKGGPENEDY